MNIEYIIYLPTGEGTNRVFISFGDPRDYYTMSFKIRQTRELLIVEIPKTFFLSDCMTISIISTILYIIKYVLHEGQLNTYHEILIIRKITQI